MYVFRIMYVLCLVYSSVAHFRVLYVPCLSTIMMFVSLVPYLLPSVQLFLFGCTHPSLPYHSVISLPCRRVPFLPVLCPISPGAMLTARTPRMPVPLRRWCARPSQCSNTSRNSRSPSLLRPGLVVMGVCECGWDCIILMYHLT